MADEGNEEWRDANRRVAEMYRRVSEMDRDNPVLQQMIVAVATERAELVRSIQELRSMVRELRNNNNINHDNDANDKLQLVNRVNRLENDHLEFTERQGERNTEMAAFQERQEQTNTTLLERIQAQQRHIDTLRSQFRATLSTAQSLLLRTSPRLYVYLVYLFFTLNCLTYLDEQILARVLQTLLTSSTYSINPLVRYPAIAITNVVSVSDIAVIYRIAGTGFIPLQVARLLYDVLIRQTPYIPSRVAFHNANSSMVDAALTRNARYNAFFQNASGRMLPALINGYTTQYLALNVIYAFLNIPWSEMRQTVGHQLASGLISYLELIQPNAQGRSMNWVRYLVNMLADIVTRPHQYRQLMRDAENGRLQGSQRLGGLLETIFFLVPSTLFMLWFLFRMSLRVHSDRNVARMVALTTTITVMTFMYYTHFNENGETTDDTIQNAGNGRPGVTLNDLEQGYVTDTLRAAVYEIGIFSATHLGQAIQETLQSLGPVNAISALTILALHFNVFNSFGAANEDDMNEMQEKDKPER